jgi:hypothetical protein
MRKGWPQTVVIDDTARDSMDWIGWVVNKRTVIVVPQKRTDMPQAGAGLTIPPGQRRSMELPVKAECNEFPVKGEC